MSVSSGIISSALDSSLTISRKTRISTVRTVWGSMEAPKDCRERNQRIRRGVRVEVTWTQTEGWNKITQAAAQPLGIKNITSRIRSTLAEDKENYLNISLKCCAIISCFLWKHWDYLWGCLVHKIQWFSRSGPEQMYILYRIEKSVTTPQYNYCFPLPVLDLSYLALLLLVTSSAASSVVWSLCLKFSK